MSTNVEPRVSPASPELALGLHNHAPAAAAEWLVTLLAGRAVWTNAAEILHLAGIPATEDNKRWLRTVRQATDGRVIGGPGSPGYRRADTFTAAEFQHWRNQMLAQCREMARGVIRADKQFYSRQTTQPFTP